MIELRRAVRTHGHRVRLPPAPPVSPIRRLADCRLALAPELRQREPLSPKTVAKVAIGVWALALGTLIVLLVWMIR